MKQVAATITFRKANYDDVFNKNGLIIENRQVFYKSAKTGKYEGPYFLSNSEDYLELMYKMDKELLLLVNFQNVCKPVTPPFQILLKCATPEDITYPNNKTRYGMLYFLEVNQTNIQGPFYLDPSVNINSIDQHIRDQKLYVLSKKQKFKNTKQKIVA